MCHSQRPQPMLSTRPGRGRGVTPQHWGVYCKTKCPPAPGCRRILHCKPKSWGQRGQTPWPCEDTERRQAEESSRSWEGGWSGQRPVGCPIPSARGSLSPNGPGCGNQSEQAAPGGMPSWLLCRSQRSRILREQDRSQPRGTTSQWAETTWPTHSPAPWTLHVHSQPHSHTEGQEQPPPRRVAGSMLWGPH